MTVKNKEVLGYRECDKCGSRGTVHQAGGRRNQLYQRCDCGCVQANGRLIQSQLWFETEWLDGAQPANPPPKAYPYDEYQDALDASLARIESRRKPGVDREAQQTRGLETESGDGQLTDVDQNIDQESDREPEPETASRGGLYWLAGGLTLIALMVGRA